MQLLQHFGEELAFDYGHDPLGPSADEPLSALSPGIRVVHGHFRPHRYAGVAGAAFVTFLREPVDNLVSIYRYWGEQPAHGNPVHDRFVAERPDIVSFARYAGLRTLMSERYFGGFDMGRFAFIGFHETRESDLRSLSGLLGLPLSANLHENRTAAPPQPLGGAVLADVRSALSHDLAFYEAMRSTHERKR